MNNKLLISSLLVLVLSMGLFHFFQDIDTKEVDFPLVENKETSGGIATLDTTDPKKVNVHGTVEVILKDAHGNVRRHIKKENLVVNDGLDFSMKRVFSESPPTSTMGFIALGDKGGGSVSPSESELGNEINNTSTNSSPCYKRGDAIITQNVDVEGESKGTVKLEKTFDVVAINNDCSTALQEGDIIVRSSGKKLDIKEAGIFDSDAGGTMFSRFIFENTVRLDSDGQSLTVIWTIDYD